MIIEIENSVEELEDMVEEILEKAEQRVGEKKLKMRTNKRRKNHIREFV